MAATATDPAAKTKEDLFLNYSPRELYLLFSGGEVTTAKPKPDPIPDPIQETVQMVVKSASQAGTVLTNLFSAGDKSSVLKAQDKLVNKADPGLVCLKASASIERQNIGGIDLANPVSDILELQQELINNRVTLQLVSNELEPRKLSP